MRSKLFVPGSRPELFAKAMAGAADALSFDLEDAVPEAGKASARDAVAAFLRGVEARSTAKTLIVRVNAPGSPAFAADIAALVDCRCDVLNLPKVEDAAAVRDALAVIAGAEDARPDARRPGVLVTIETPRALADAAAIASAHPRIVGLQLGLADLFEPHGIDRKDPRNLHAAMYAMRMAAAQAGVYALDAAFPGVDDETAFMEEAGMSKRLGYLGKSCIHPRQVAWANAAYAPTAAEFAWAERVVAAARIAAGQGSGVCVVDGKMIDAPFVKRAQQVLAMRGEA